MPDAEQVPAGVDATRPSPARLSDFYLGGTNNFEVDRRAAEQIRAQLPELDGDICLRSSADIERFFDGLQLAAPHDGAKPGISHVGSRGAEDPAQADSDGSRFFFGGFARRP